MLFKYLPPERKDVLENLCIRFTPLRSLNDPFESLPLVDTTEHQEQLVKEAVKELDELWANAREEDKTEANLQELKEVRNGTLEIIKRRLEPSEVGRVFAQAMGSKLEVLSLSRTERSLLMWSHYTDEGKGFEVGVDDLHPFFHEQSASNWPTGPIPVVYSVKRSKVDQKDKRWYERLLCEKPIDWSYEEEERVFRMYLSSTGSKGKDRYGQDIILTELPKEVVRCIYIGYRADDAFTESI